MLRHGITASSTPDNYNLFRKLQILTFDGKTMLASGPPIGE
jgi:hypothetical protein